MSIEREKIQIKKGNKIELEQELQKIKDTMTRAANIFKENGIRYAFVGGAWIQMLLCDKNIDYFRSHVDVDVIIDGGKGVDLLKNSNYLLNEGIPNEAGHKEDYSGMDTQTGIQVGIFIKSIPQDIVKIMVEGTEMTGQSAEDEYLIKNSNIQSFLNKDQQPRKVDITDAESLQQIIQSKVVQKKIKLKVVEGVSESIRDIREILEVGGLEKLKSIIKKIGSTAKKTEEADRLITVLEGIPDDEKYNINYILSVVEPFIVKRQKNKLEQQYGISIREDQPYFYPEDIKINIIELLMDLSDGAEQYSILFSRITDHLNRGEFLDKRDCDNILKTSGSGNVNQNRIN